MNQIAEKEIAPNESHQSPPTMFVFRNGDIKTHFEPLVPKNTQFRTWFEQLNFDLRVRSIPVISLEKLEVRLSFCFFLLDNSLTKKRGEIERSSERERERERERQRVRERDRQTNRERGEIEREERMRAIKRERYLDRQR